jgi:hypothetical protein
MDWQAEERVIPEITQFALVIAKGQTSEPGSGDDEGVQPLFGGFGRFGLHFLAGLEQRVCQKPEYLWPFTTKCESRGRGLMCG